MRAMSGVLLVALLGASDPTEERGEIEIALGDATYTKRHVLRYPDAPFWNGKLVIAAHGGRGGEAYSRDGRVTGTDETSLDDVVGEHALARGYAYASLDRDGIGGTREGLELTRAFTRRMRARLEEDFGREVSRTYLVGLSMGGGIARYAAEDGVDYDAVVIVAGAHGDAATRLERRARMALAWPAVDPGKVAAPSRESLERYAEAVGTPVAARAFWPFIGSSTSVEDVLSTLEGHGVELDPSELADFRVADHPRLKESLAEEDTTGRVRLPTIEVAGTYDDFVLPEILRYREKVEAAGLEERHRLYRVRGAWHISRDDDAIGSFQFLGTRMGLPPASVDAMATGTSYLWAVREALDLLDAWVGSDEPPPQSRILDEGEPIAP